jgi:hypothetical protein
MASTLFACPSCQNGCATNAHFCPSCGHVFEEQVKMRPGDGWSMTIFWGIMLAWIIPTILTIVLAVILFVIGAIGVVSLTPRDQPTPTPTERR